MAANKKPKLAKNTRSSDGKVLKEISRETQQLGKVTRFQLLDEKPRQNVYTLPKAEARKIKDDWSTVSDISTIEEASYSGLNKGKVTTLYCFIHNYMDSCLAIFVNFA